MKGIKRLLPMLFGCVLVLSGCDQIFEQVENAKKERLALVQMSENAFGMGNIIRKTHVRLYKTTDPEERLQQYQKAIAAINRLEQDFINSPNNEPQGKVMVRAFVPYALAVTQLLKTRDEFILPLIISNEDLYMAAKDPETAQRFIELFNQLPQKLLALESQIDELAQKNLNNLHFTQFSEALNKGFDEYVHKEHDAVKEALLKHHQDLLKDAQTKQPIFAFLAANPDKFRLVYGELYFPDIDDKNRYKSMLQDIGAL